MKLFDTNLVAQGLLFEAIFVRSFDEYKAKGGEHDMLDCYVPHDIDVIVPVDVFRILVDIIDKSYLFDHGPHSTYGNCLCASYIVKGKDNNPVVVDILAGSVNPPVRFNEYRPSGIYLQDLCQIREIKMNWNRSKDRADVELINKFLEPSLVHDLNKELDALTIPAPVTPPVQQDDDDDLPF